MHRYQCPYEYHFFMFGVSSYLHDFLPPEAPDRLSGTTDYIELMNEGQYFLNRPLHSCSTHFSTHTPYMRKNRKPVKTNPPSEY
jgi:hypothetical protein